MSLIYRLTALSLLCSVAPAVGQVIPDKGTATTVSKAASGHVTVGIASASSSGISHNTYTEFSARKAGVGLGNRGIDATTIVNEVTSARRSFINGPVEVIGSRAHVVLANPNGITVNGGRFINTGGVALSAGGIRFEDAGAGRFNTILTTGDSDITVTGKGLSGAMTTLQLIAGRLRIDGAVKNTSVSPSADISLVAGRSEVTLDSSVSPLTTLHPLAKRHDLDDAAKNILIDITPRGSLSASRINVSVNSRGAGVSFAGRGQATIGDFMISAHGKVTTRGVVNAGIIDGSEIVDIEGDSLKNQGSVAADASIASKVLQVEVGGTITLGAHSLLYGKNDAFIKAKTVASDFFTNTTNSQGRFVAANNLNFTLTSGGWTFNDDLKIKGNLFFKVAGDVENYATVAAGGTLDLISTKGSITNGSNSTASPGGGLIYSNSDMLLKAGDDIRNYASTIQSGGNLILEAGGTILNTRTDTKIEQTSYWIPGGTPALAIVETMVETSNPASIDAMGDVTMTAAKVENVASSVIAGNDFSINAGTIVNHARTLTKDETHYRKDEVFIIYNDEPVGLSAALFVAGNLFKYDGNLKDDGTIQANKVVGHGSSVSIGGKSATAPSRIPDPLIDLGNAFDLIGAGLVKGSGPAYVAAPDAKAGSATAQAGDKLSATVDASGKPVDRPDDKDVKVGGRVTFLYATPVPSGQSDRNPSWIFAQVEADATNLTFLADPMTERRLIQQALIEQTGRAILDPKYRNPREQQEALYEGTVDFLHANPEIKIGSKLTTAQRAKIKKPILWYEYQVVDGKKVLVPQLILPEKDLAKYAKITGGAILANDISITADKVTNTGTILAVNSLSIDAKEFLNERRVAGTGSWASPFAVQEGGMISAKTVVINTTRDLINRGGSIIGSERVTLTAGGNIRIEAQTVKNSFFTGNKKNWSLTTDVKNYGGLVSSGGNLVMVADKTLNILGSTVAAKDDAVLIGKKGVTIASVIDERHISAGGKKSGFLTKSSFSYSENSLTNLSSVVSAGGNMTVRSETGDITIAASHLSAKKDLTVLAGYDENGKAVRGSRASVNVISGQDVLDTAFSKKKSGFGLFATGGGVDFYRSTKTALTQSEVRNVASSLAADGNLLVKGTRDVNVIGSVLTAEGSTTVKASRDVNVGPGTASSQFAFSKKERGFGVSFSGGNGGFSVSNGVHASSRFTSHDLTTATPSIINGGKGVEITARRNVTLEATAVASKGHVEITAVKGDVKLLAGENREQSFQSSKQMFAGITLKVSQNVTGALDQLKSAPGTFTSGYGGAGYKTVGVVSGTLQAVDALKQLTNPTISASLMAGVNGSSSSRSGSSTTPVPTTITAGSFTLKAGGNAHLVGTQVDVKNDVVFDVGGHLKVESAKAFAYERTSSNSWGVGAGASINVGLASGVSAGFTVEGNFAKEKGSNWSVTNLNAHIKSGGKTTIKTGGDAIFAGATVEADRITADVGGDMTVKSRQDLGQGGSSSVNGSVSATMGVLGPSSATVSLGGGKGSSDFAWVKEQSGFFSKKEQDVIVKGHTQLDGAALNSETGQLTLDSGTLGFSDIKDHDKGSSISGQVGISTPGAPGTLPGVTVSGGYAMHDKEQVTKATIGEGTIVVRDKDGQKQDVADINRDIDKAQVITKDERAGLQVYASTSAVTEIASGFEGIQDNLAKSASTLGHLDQLARDAFGAGKSLAQVAGIMLNQAKEPALAKALADRELSPSDALKQLRANCGPGRQGFNLHDLLFTPAYADSCTVTTISGRTIVISDVKSCADVLVSALLGQALALSWNAGEFTSGIKSGVLKQGQEFIDLASDPVGLAQSLGGLISDLITDPKGTARTLGVAAVDGMQETAYRYIEALDKGDYSKAGELISSLAVDLAIRVVAPGVGITLGTLKGLDKIKAIARNFERPDHKFKFKSGTVAQHFEKHGDEIKDLFGYKKYTLEQYVADAQHVAHNGTYVKELNGYVIIAGGLGQAKVLFVGLDRSSSEITTLHVKTVGWLEEKAPSLGWSKNPKGTGTDTVGPYPRSGYTPPYHSRDDR